MPSNIINQGIKWSSLGELYVFGTYHGIFAMSFVALDPINLFAAQSMRTKL